MAGFGGFGPAQGIVATAIVDVGTVVSGATANGILYANSSGILDTTSSGLFNGTHAALGPDSSIDQNDIDATATSSILSLKQIFTATSGEPFGINNFVVSNPAGASSAFIAAAINQAQIQSANGQTHGIITACYNVNRHSGTAAASVLNSVYGEVSVVSTGGATTTRGIFGTVTLSGGATVTNHRAGDFLAQCSSTSTATNLTASKFLAQLAGSGTTATARGVQVGITKSSSGTITLANVVDIDLDCSGTGSIVEARGINFSGWSNSGTVTTSYAIYADTSIDLGSTKWFIHSLSASNSGLSGDLLFKSDKVVSWTDGAITGTVDSSIERTAATTLGVRAGTGTGRPRIGGTLDINVTAVGNVDAGTDDLMTYALPANSLSANLKAVRVTARGTTANNGNAKTLTFNVGSQTVLTTSLTASIAGQWEILVYIVRTGTGTQDISARLLQGATVIIDQEFTAGTQDETAAITLKCTGAATTTNDIVQELMHTEFIS